MCNVLMCDLILKMTAFFVVNSTFTSLLNKNENEYLIHLIYKRSISRFLKFLRFHTLKERERERERACFNLHVLF